MKARILFHGATVLVLVATFAAAQTPATPKKPTTPASTGETHDREGTTPSVSEGEVHSGATTGKRQHGPVLTSAAPAEPAGHSADRESSAPSVSEVTMGSGQTTDRKSGSVIVVDREASSGMATGRRQHEPVLAPAAATQQNGQTTNLPSLKSMGSAHATESLATSAPGSDGQKQGASSNPMYQDKGTAGTNPLYQSKDKQAAPKPSTGHDTVEYKDGEDMTTRYRPGNNKTAKTKPATSTGTTPPSR